jgi:hypothetical protein
MEMIDALFEAYAAEHLQTEPIACGHTVILEKTNERVSGIVFVKATYVYSSEAATQETYYIKDSSEASFGEFVMFILPRIRELNEQERELVMAKEVPVEGVFCIYRMFDVLRITEYDHYLLRPEVREEPNTARPDSFKTGTLFSSAFLDPMFFSTNTVVLL